MRPPYHVVNLRSRGGDTARRWPRLFDALAARGIIGDYALTRSRGHGYELAKNALEQGHDTIIAVGGDGTIFEVVNAVIDAGAAGSVSIGTIPMGSGKDVARCLNMYRPPQAMRAIQEGHVRDIDVGRVEAVDNHGRPLVKHFLLEASAGWVPEISAAVPTGLKRFGDTFPYLLSAAMKLAGPMGRDFIVQVDNDFYDGRYNTISVHNMEYWGGDLRAAPGARPDDGLLDVIRWADLGRRAVLSAVQGQRKGGRHLCMDGVDHHQARTISLASGKRTALDLDGEQAGYLPARISVVPAAIRFLAPPEPRASA